MNRTPATVAIVMLSASILTGCDDAPRHPASVPEPITAVAETMISTLKAGDEQTATRLFIETDWATAQLFSDGSPANLSESQFASHVIKGGTSDELYSLANGLQAVATAVRSAGQELNEKGDIAMARKNFEALQHCGDTLTSSNRTTLFQLVGRTIKAIGEAELKKMANGADLTDQKR